MKRQEHEAAVRSKIIKAARLLFLQQGYHQTTIRQIKAAADVKTGTLYHFYEDKEDVFFNIVREAFFRTLAYTKELVPPGEKMLHQACEIAWHIHIMAQHEPTAELYLISYNSPRIAVELIKEQCNRSQDVFQKSAPHLSPQDHDMRAMMAKGFMQSIAQYAVQKKLTDAPSTIQSVVSLCFSLYNVSDTEIAHILEQLYVIDIESHVRDFLP